MPPLATRAHHAKADGPEQPEQTDDCDVECAIQRPIDLLVELACCPIDAEAGSQDSEIKCWVVVMNVRDTSHSDKRKIV